MERIVIEKWQCSRCGRYYYINKGASSRFGKTRCPFFCFNGEGVYIRDVWIVYR